jgi:hypothetical protein
MIMHPGNLGVGVPGGEGMRGVPGITETEEGLLSIGLQEYRKQACRLALSVATPPRWVKIKNPNAPPVKREAEEDWGR